MSSIFSGMGASYPGLITGPTFQPGVPHVSEQRPQPAVQPPADSQVFPPVYASTDLEPQSLAFGPPSSGYLLRTLQDLRSLIRPSAANDSQQLPAVPTGWQPRLESLAHGLGFSDFRQLQYQLRNLPPAITEQWLQGVEDRFKALPPTEQTAETLTDMAQQHLEQSVMAATQTIFEQTRAPLPSFRAEAGSRWTASARLSVFNALTEIRQSQPESTFRKVLSRADGKPLTFVRQPAPALNAQDKALSLLSKMMKVACHDTCNGHIKLSDGAIQTNPRELLAHPAIQDFLRRANQPGVSPDKQEAVRSVQELLNFSRPAERALPLTGQWDEATRSALRSFEAQQHLIAARDLLDDDRSLATPHKQTLQQPLQAMLYRLQQGAEPEVIQRELQSHLQMLLGTAGLQTQTRQRIEHLQQQTAQPLSGQFDQKLLEKQTANWYGIIDGGQNLDFTEQTIVHELGHGLQNRSGILDNWQRISWEAPATTEDENRADMRATLNAIGKKGFASPYGHVNAGEDFAEAYRVFTYQPERLLQQSLLKFVFMAGITGAYKGKEQQMLDLMKKAGYQDDHIRQAVLHLRGHLPEALAQDARNTIEGYATALKTLSPLVGYGVDLVAGVTGVKDQLIETLRKKQEPEKIVQFDPGIATAIPELDHLLKIRGREYAPRIDDPGYLLEKMSLQQAVLVQPGTSTAARDTARAQLKNFADQGLNAFSPLEQRALSPRVQSFLSGSQAKANQAILLALSKILGKSYAAQNIDQQGNSIFEVGLFKNQSALFRAGQIRYLKEVLTGVQKNPELLRQELGSELYDLLPESFIALLQEPQFIHEITGYQGEISISPNTIFDYTCSELQRRSGEQQELFKTSVQNMLRMVKRENLTAAYGVYQKMIESYNSFKAEKATLLNPEQFQQHLSDLKQTATPDQFVMQPDARPTPRPPEQQILHSLGIHI